MTTSELLEEARNLAHAHDDAGMDRLVVEHCEDKLFASLVALQRALVPAIVQVWRENGLLLD